MLSDIAQGIIVKPTSIVWIAPEVADLGRLFEALSELGFAVESGRVGAATQQAAQLRVLQADAFNGPDQLRDEYQRDPRPTLVLTRSQEQDLGTLPFLDEQDELAPFTDNAELLALRLTRLSARTSHARLPATQQIDNLTGLPSRERFEAELEQALESLQAEQSKALLYLDLDHFKQINARHSRWGGDLILVQLAMLMSDELAPGDKLAHLGADKFVCLMERYDRATLLGDAKRLLLRIAEHPFVIETDDAAPAQVALTASAGLSHLLRGASAAEMWRQLDVAVFDAKTKGRNQLGVYTEPSGIRPLGTTPQDQARLQHFLNVTKVVSERIDQLLKPLGPGAVDAALREDYEDPLTHLNNRRYFDLRLEREFGSARKHGRMLCIAWMDVCHLHEINRRFGWAAGDKVLQALAERALSSIRLVDWIARCGGQEFCLVMPDTDLLEGQRVADRVRVKLESCGLTAPDGRPMPVELNMGLAQIGDQMPGPDQLIQKAIEALHKNKSVHPAA